MKRRNQKVCLTILAFALALSGNGCFAPPSLSLPKHPEKLFVYEGLPHPFRERVLFEKERRGQENEEIHGHRFYSQKTEAKGIGSVCYVCFVRRGGLVQNGLQPIAVHSTRTLELPGRRRRMSFSL